MQIMPNTALQGKRNANDEFCQLKYLQTFRSPELEPLAKTINVTNLKIHFSHVH